MTLLLDTDAYLWFVLGEARLSEAARVEDVDIVDNHEILDRYSVRRLW